MSIKTQVERVLVGVTSTSLGAQLGMVGYSFIEVFRGREHIVGVAFAFSAVAGALALTSTSTFLLLNRIRRE